MVGTLKDDPIYLPPIVLADSIASAKPLVKAQFWSLSKAASLDSQIFSMGF
jgi:hypothetical protein